VTSLKDLMAFRDQEGQLALLERKAPQEADFFFQELVKFPFGVAGTVSYTHLRAHETKANIVCCLLLEKKKAAITTQR